MKINLLVVLKWLFVCVIGFGMVVAIASQFAPDMSKMHGKAALRQAYEIHKALVSYAQIHNGNLPESQKSSNEAYRALFQEGWMDDEKIFYVQRSAWSANRPDGEIGTLETDFSQALAPGENHWAYTSGLNMKRDSPTLPLIMDGFTEQVGVWTDDRTKKGGLWRGKFQIMVRLGGNAALLPTKEATTRLEEIKRIPNAKLLNPD